MIVSDRTRILTVTTIMAITYTALIDAPLGAVIATGIAGAMAVTTSVMFDQQGR